MWDGRQDVLILKIFKLVATQTDVVFVCMYNVHISPNSFSYRGSYGLDKGPWSIQQSVHAASEHFLL